MTGGLCITMEDCVLVQILTSSMPYAGVRAPTNPLSSHTHLLWRVLCIHRLLAAVGCMPAAFPKDIINRSLSWASTALAEAGASPSSRCSPPAPYACSLHNSSHRIFGPAAASNSSLEIFQFLFQENPGSLRRKTKEEPHPSPPIQSRDGQS